MATLRSRRIPAHCPALVALCVCLGVSGATTPEATAQLAGGRSPLVHKVEQASDRLELIVHSSKIITLDQKIPEAQVNNPEIVKLTPLTENRIQLSGLKAGVTQVIVWNEDKVPHTIDIIVLGDAQELTMLLKREFPKASLKVTPVADGVIVGGFVDHPDHAARVIEIAQQFYPKTINTMRVGGVQQVLLKIRFFEVSRTKMRRLGVDFAQFSGGFIASNISGLLASVSSGAGSVTASGQSLSFGVVDGGSSFFGFLDALQQNDLAKIMAQPNLVAYSGRPASFNDGGEFPILVPQSLGTVAIEYKKFGTQLDFVPIVLGNGNIRLELRPRVSELDTSRGVTINNINVPALRVREADTGVEMKAGQTLAIAGLVQVREEAQKKGLPWVSDLPWAGAAFRKVQYTKDEIELVILVTPELVDAMDKHEVPECFPGQFSKSPNDVQLYLRGHIEVPDCCPKPGCEGCLDGGLGRDVTNEMPAESVPAGARQAEPVQPKGARNDPAAARGVRNPQAATGSPRTGSNMAVNSRMQPNGPSGGQFVQNDRYQRPSPQQPTAPAENAGQKSLPALIGPVGYDVDR